MKKITYIILIVAIITNLYLVFVWQPEELDISCESANVSYSYKPVYKVSTSDIEKNISDSEKSEIKSIMEKLSIVDIEKIKEDFSEGDEKSMRDAFKIMERRLPHNDYNKLKEICSEFINMSIIDNV